MGNLTEAQTWEAGIYRLETTDALLGGENGTANVQAKQLANRTLYLKKFVEALESSLSGIDLTMQAHMQAVLKFALEQAALANSGVRALHRISQQQGEFTLFNYGIVSGAVVSKKGANRLLSIAAGVCYLEGRKFYVPAQDSTVSVPVGEAVNGTVYAYLQLVAGIPKLRISTVSNPTPPPSTVTLLSITIPALDSSPDLAACTLSSRLCPTEPDYPNAVGTPATITVPLAFSLPDTGYTIEFEVLSAVGSPCDERNLKVTTRNTNNFIVTLLSAADDVVVRWKLSRLNSVSAHSTNDWRSRFEANPSNSIYPTIPT